MLQLPPRDVAFLHLFGLQQLAVFILLMTAYLFDFRDEITRFTPSAFRVRVRLGVRLGVRLRLRLRLRLRVRVMVHTVTVVGGKS
jgi:hypothetical protein